MKATKIAIGSFVYFMAQAFVSIELSRLYWVVWFAVPILLLIILVGFTAEAWVYGIRESTSSLGAFREAVAIPASLLVAMLLYGPVQSLGNFVFAWRYLATHRLEMAALEKRYGPNEPVAMSYYQGVPDTGISIVHSPARSPMRLSVHQQIDLLSEPLNWCHALEPSYYVCSHGG